MIFADKNINEIPEGAILAHSVEVGKQRLKKGTSLCRLQIDELSSAGLEKVIVAILEDGDLHEDIAATRVAKILAGANLSATLATTGRVNLIAESDGLTHFDLKALQKLNQLDERITVATLRNHEAVAANQMVATIKIIPFGLEEQAVQAWEELARELHDKPISVASYQHLSVSLIQTVLPGTSEKLLDKTARVLSERLEIMGCHLSSDVRVAHDQTQLSGAIISALSSDPGLLILSGASAITDRRDTLPAGLEHAGGSVAHVGMPVDPGNLLMYGHKQNIPVIGMPGCARSPKLNGFDWVLQRLVCGLELTSKDLRDMGIGGLLKEIPSRPMPRSSVNVISGRRDYSVTPLILAAGQSTRMGQENKLLYPMDGKPMLQHVAELVQSKELFLPAVAVTGHQHQEVESLLRSMDVLCAHNPDYETGMSSSLRRGVAHLPAECDAVMVLLGDMPLITTDVFSELIAAFDPGNQASICLPSYQGQRGHPVLISRRFFPELHDIRGDRGARDLIKSYADEVCEVPVTCPGILKDFDTPEAFSEV